MDAVKQGNGELDNGGIIITFGLGSGVDDSILRTLASQNNLGTAEVSVRRS